jgi:hypothetical protein
MRSSTTPKVVVIGLIGGLASSSACSSGASGFPFILPEAGASGSATGIAGGSGMTGTTDAGDATVDAAPGEVPTTGADGDEITKIVPTKGCGMDPGQAVGVLVMGTIMTMGTKDASCADSQCGAWSYARDYWVRLPTGYDKTKAYPLVFEGPGCGGHGNNLYSIPVFDTSVIVVGLSPSAEAQAFHATNPGQGCFDNKEGDDSVDWVFYENLYDQLAGTLCFDRNRVFGSGYTSGGWLANELGCKYAGDATRPIRGILVDSGGLPTDPNYVPTCTAKPMAGFWSHETTDTTTPFLDDVVAMNRALVVNACGPPGVTYQTATFDPFPISGLDSTSCKRYRACPNLYPLVVCAFPGNGKSSHDNIVVPGWPTFLKLFSAPPL